MRIKQFLAILFFLVSLNLISQEKPDSFATHKVKKKETLYGLARKYDLQIEQILQYNPLIKKIGLKKRMLLQIPVYLKPEPITKSSLPDSLTMYLVQPKETKWRLAYRFGITIQELEKYNPEIILGLKIGQELIVPIRTEEEILQLEKEFNYYTVKLKEGYYRLEKKLGVAQAELILLNPILQVTGLQEGMILKIPPKLTGDLKIENSLLVEKMDLRDSIPEKSKITLGLLLPFKANQIEFDSIDKTKQLLKKRNLHTLALDFYSGVYMAVEEAGKLGIEVVLNVFDTQNDKDYLKTDIARRKWSNNDVIIGPMIPSNFDILSLQDSLQLVPMIAPLSSNPVKSRENVYQSVTSPKLLREKMFLYLDKVLDSTQNVVLITDTLNREVETKLHDRFPFAQILRPEPGGYVVPDLIDSLLVDTLINKVVFESQNLGLIASVTSLLNSQISKERDVQLFTTFRSNTYNNQNISKRQLGNLKFTYTAGEFSYNSPRSKVFDSLYVTAFGDLPKREALRGYDVTLDVILRWSHINQLSSDSMGETEYIESRFDYVPNSAAGYENRAFYLLRHGGYEIFEIKK